jgi:CRISPR-associated protein Cas5h
MTDITRILAFELWGDYAHFRRPYSTTSPTTFPFPTRTALAGLIAAILGRERDTYYDEFSFYNSRIGLQILSPLSKMSIGVNLVDTKKGLYLWDISENPRTQILYEVLKDVRYRIYVWIKSDETYTRLKRKLEEHTSTYTLYLGIAQMLANFNFLREYDSIKQKEVANGESVSIDTIVPEVHGIMPKINHKISRVNIPIYMDANRLAEYKTIVYDACTNYTAGENHLLYIRRGKYLELEDDRNIILL